MAFQAWFTERPPTDVTVFSDGSEQHVDGARKSHAFNAEAVGAWRGLEHAFSELSPARIWLCIDSTSVIWGIQGDAPATSQWAFLNVRSAMEQHDIQLKWSPATWASKATRPPTPLRTKEHSCAVGFETTPARRGGWWTKASAKLSRRYRQWDFTYEVKPPPELDLHRPVLHRWLALRSSRGDFDWYHRRFCHGDAKLTCSCGRNKSPEHLALCTKAQCSH
ncbi:hypothetical protein CNMCM5793_008043 [Aspergillus hiratsukae]|nr:hypothetical protein CNMCM5793_008043 [Aspergillus hiratsukae]